MLKKALPKLVFSLNFCRRYENELKKRILKVQCTAECFQLILFFVGHSKVQYSREDN